MPEIGEIWDPTIGLGPVMGLLVVEKIGDDLVNCVPVHHCAEFAGPSDLLTWRGLIGPAPTVVCLGMAGTYSNGSLFTKRQSIDAEFAKEFSRLAQALSAGEDRLATLLGTWGGDYGEEGSPKDIYMGELIDRIGDLQQDVWAALEEEAG